MTKKRILITDGLGKAGIDLLKTHPDLDLDLRSSTSAEDLMKMIGDYDALVVRSMTAVTAPVIEVGRKLKLVVASGAGFDNIDVAAARLKKITVLNCPTANSLSAAEQTLGLMFSLARSIPRSHASLRAGNWDRGPAFIGTELHGKILGIIGLGNIGKIMAEKAMALGMLVVGYDTAITSMSAFPPKFKYLEMRFKLARDQSEVLAEADWVTIHIPKEERNIGLFDASTIAEMKKGAYLVNASRGGIVDEQALLAALESGHLAGAAADVFEHEPPKFSDPTFRGLLEHPRFVATAHLGGSTFEAKERVAAQTAQQILSFFNEPSKDGEITGALH